MIPVFQTQEANSGESARSWSGYFLGSPGDFSTLDEEDWAKALATRNVGMKNNRIIGGLLLHTTRTEDIAECSTDSLSNRLDATCSINSLRSTLSSNGASDERLDQLFGTDAVRSYGIDPVFLRSSTLYDTGLLNQYDVYYNTSNSSEVGPNGVPLGFRWRDMKGYENGFPYLMDGNYLDDQTKGMTAEILSYNRDLHVLGYARGNFKWMLDGSIKVNWEFLGLPALDYLKDSYSTLQANLKVFGKELVPLWILIGFFTLYTMWHLVDSIHYYGRVEASHPVGAEWSLKRGLGALPTDSKLVYDLLLVGVMVAGGVVWSLYMGKYATEARYTYNVYDSVTGRANWLLPIREDAVAIQEATTIESLLTGSLTATTAGIDNNVLDSLNISSPWSAGMAGRYLLPEADDPNMDDLSEVMSMAHTLASYYTTYGIIQAVIIIMLILRLISSFSFQQRLGIIGDTLVRAMPLLVHVFLLFLVVLLMFAVAAYIMLGWRHVEVATYTDALQDTALSLVDVSRMQDTTNAFLSDSHSFKTLVEARDDDTPLGLIVLPIEHFVVALMSIFSFFFMQNVLLVFLLAHLLNVFSVLKSDLAKGSSGSVLSDLKLTVFPSMWIRLQRLIRKPALPITRASGRIVSHHPDDSDGPTTMDKSKPETFDELRKFLSDSILPGVNQHNGAMQQVKGVRVGAVYIDEHMTQALLIATALEMEQSKHGTRHRGMLHDSQYRKVLIRALDVATELHKSMGNTLHVPHRDLVQGPTFAIQDNCRPIAEGAEASEEDGVEHEKIVVLRSHLEGLKKIGNKVVPLENDKVVNSSDSPVDESQGTNLPLKKSSEIKFFRARNKTEKGLQAVSFPGRSTVAWEGPMNRDDLLGLTLPRTMTQVPFLQLPAKTLMQMLGEGFPDPKTSHWTSNFHGPQLMNATMPVQSGAALLHTRNQLFNMLVRAVVATARWQQLVTEWQVKSWDETRVALGHNTVRVQRFGKSGSSQDAKSIEILPGLHAPAGLSSRRTSLASAIEVVEKGHPLLWHSSMDPATTNIDPDVARLWLEMMLRFDKTGLDALRGLSSTPPDAGISSTESSTSLNPSSRPSQPLQRMSSAPTDAGTSGMESRARASSSSSTSQPLHTIESAWPERESFDTVRGGAKLGRNDSKEQDLRSGQLPMPRISKAGGPSSSRQLPMPRIAKQGGPSSSRRLSMPEISKPGSPSPSGQQLVYNFDMQPGGLPMPRISKPGGPSSSKQLPMPRIAKPGGPSTSREQAAYNFDMQPGGLPMPKISKPGGPLSSRHQSMPGISEPGGPSSSSQQSAYNFGMQPGGLPMPKISKMGAGDASTRMSSGKSSITGQARRAAKRSPRNSALLGTIQGDDWKDRAREADIGLDELQQQWSIELLETEMSRVGSIKSLADRAQQ
eukprot:gene8477-4838_t